MKTINTFLFVLTILLFTLDGFSNNNREAWKKFKFAKFEIIEEQPNSDATIIFDRSYISTNEVGNKVEQTQIVHKKYKINSLYALEQLNKIYIRVINDLHYRSELIDVKVKAINANNDVILTDISQIVTTVLPANYNAYYKVDGNLKMLAIQGLELGNQVEIIYEVKKHYDTAPYWFYDSDEILLGDEFYCLEKSIYLESEDFEMKVLSFNEDKNYVRTREIEDKKTVSIKVKDIAPIENHFYNKPYIDRIYFRYLIAIETERNTLTWEGIMNDLESTNSSFKRQEIFQESKLSEIREKFISIPTTKRKFQYLLESVNKSLEKNLQFYEDVKEDIDIAWANACMISTLLKKLKVPVNFHFVVNSNNGKFDRDYVTIYQFDKIFLSFTWKGQQHYFPLLEPYSEFDEISSKYAGTDCLTIVQTGDGRQVYKFDKMPESDIRDQLDRKIEAEIVPSSNDSITLAVNETLIFEGNSYLDLKPYIKECINNKEIEEDIKDDFIKTFILTDILPIEDIDSLSITGFNVDSGKVKIDVYYEILKQVFTKNNIFSLSPNLFVLDDFYTPFHLKKTRNSNGYLYNETDIDYEITFKSQAQMKYLISEEENSTENELAKVSHNINKDNGALNIDLSVSYKTEKFEKDQWGKMMDIREKCHQLLNQNIYFQW